MTKLKKFNFEGQAIGQIDVDSKLVDAKANGQMIKDYIVALRANARQWSANTKTRSEVKHTTKKPHPQKGGGRARQGSLVSPQYRGGGRVFGPKPKFDQHVKINKKERQAAIRCLLAEKIQDGKLHILETTQLDAPKTKTVSNFLKSCDMTGRVLFLGEGNYASIAFEESEVRFSVPTDAHSNFVKSMRNLPKVGFSLACNISGYDVVAANHIVMTEAAFKEIQQWLC